MKNKLFFLLFFISAYSYGNQEWLVKEREYRALFEIAKEGLILRGQLLLADNGIDLKDSVKESLDSYFSSMNVLLSTQFKNNSYAKLKNEEFCELKIGFIKVTEKYASKEGVVDEITKVMLDAGSVWFAALETKYNCTPGYKIRRKR